MEPNALLKLISIKPGEWDGDFIATIEDFKGRIYEGIFHATHFKDSKLKVMASEGIATEQGEVAVLTVPHGGIYGLYGKNREGGKNLSVKKSDLEYIPAA